MKAPNGFPVLRKLGKRDEGLDVVDPNAPVTGGLHEVIGPLDERHTVGLEIVEEVDSGATEIGQIPALERGVGQHD